MRVQRAHLILVNVYVFVFHFNNVKTQGFSPDFLSIKFSFIFPALFLIARFSMESFKHLCFQLNEFCIVLLVWRLWKEQRKDNCKDEIFHNLKILQMKKNKNVLKI